MPVARPWQSKWVKACYIEPHVAMATVLATVTIGFVYVKKKNSVKMSENLFETNLKKNLEENSTESFSNFRSLTVTTLTSSVILKWLHEPPQSISDPSKEIVFKLLKLETRDEWKAIAWTRKMTCKIENLEQNVCYSLQLLVMVEDENEFKVVDESDVFKVRHAHVECKFLKTLRKSWQTFSARFRISRRIKHSSEWFRSLKWT